MRKAGLVATVAVGLAALVGVGVFAWPGRQTPATPAVTANAASGAKQSRLSWRGLGERLLYGLNYDVSSNSGQALAFKLTGKLELTCIRVAEEGATFRAAFQGDVTASRDGKVDPGIASMLAAGLGQPFFYELDPVGQVRELRFPLGVTRLAQTLARSIFTSSQLVRSASTNDLWQSDELDENGTFLAQYERRGQSFVHKEKLRYRSSHSEQARHRVLASSTDFELDAERRLRSVTATEAVSVSSTLPVPEMSSSLGLTLKLLSVQRGGVDPSWLQAWAAAERLALSEPGTKSSVDAELDGARASKLSPEESLVRLKATLGGRMEERAVAYNALMSHVRLDAKLVEQLLEHIRKRGPLSADLISVLRDAGSPEAQAALRELLKDSELPDAERMQVVRGLSRVDRPTAETVQMLTELVADPKLGEQAQYGLGGNAYRLQESNPALAQAAVAVIQTRLERAQDDSTRQVALLALGNAGVPDTLPAVQGQLASPNTGVQVAATQALRRIPGATSDTLLAKQLREAKALDVRIAAAEAIRYREPTPVLVTALVDSLRLDAEIQVRRASMDVAAYFAHRSSALRDALHLAASGDPDPGLRERAQTHLKAL